MGAGERWAGFLAQIDGRARAVRDEALAAARASFPTVTADTTGVAIAWGAVDSRLQELERMVADTWQAKVDAAFDAEGGGPEIRAAALERGDDLRFALEDAREVLGHQIMAEMADHLFVRGASERGRFCTSCGAALETPIVFRAVELTCRCGARNMFEPGALLRAAGATGAHAMSQLAALPAWRAMRIAERNARKIRPPCPLGLLKASERAQIAYWTLYLHNRSRYEPELARQPLYEVRARMDHWYRAAEHEEEWQRAGCPRDLP